MPPCTRRGVAPRGGGRSGLHLTAPPLPRAHLRLPAQIVSLFRAIGSPFGDAVLEEVYAQVAEQDEGHVSIASFRAALFERL